MELVFSLIVLHLSEYGHLMTSEFGGGVVFLKECILCRPYDTEKYGANIRPVMRHRGNVALCGRVIGQLCGTCIGRGMGGFRRFDQGFDAWQCRLTSSTNKQTALLRSVQPAAAANCNSMLRPCSLERPSRTPSARHHLPRHQPVQTFGLLPGQP